MTHKKGDKVICIDDTASFGRLRSGNIYTVELAYDGTPTVIVNGSYHSLDRFASIERVADEKPEASEATARRIADGIDIEARP